MVNHTIIMTENQVKIAISILDNQAGYCGDDDDELYDLINTLERCLQPQPDISKNEVK